MEKKTVLENLDLVLLVMDETVDGGYVHLALEHRDQSVCCRVFCTHPGIVLMAVCMPSHYNCKYSQQM